MVTYHCACFVVMICQVGPVIGEFEGLKVEVSFHPW